MGSGGNSGNFLNPQNLALNVLTGGVGYGIKELKRNMTPDKPPTPPPPPDPNAVFHASDVSGAETMQQRQKKLAAMQFGYASTMTSKGGLGAAPLSTPTASPLKAKLGQ